LSIGKEQKNKKTEEKRRTITSFSFGLSLRRWMQHRHLKAPSTTSLSASRHLLPLAGCAATILKNKEENNASAQKEKTTTMIGCFIVAWNQRPIVSTAICSTASNRRSALIPFPFFFFFFFFNPWLLDCSA
jgi:hypothetical protein